jgi:hypothetical protein
MQFHDLLRYFFDSRAHMALCLEMSATTLRQWEQQDKLTEAQRGRILGAALVRRAIPLDWLIPYAKVA